jgi:hypothetical protein
MRSSRGPTKFLIAALVIAMLLSINLRLVGNSTPTQLLVTDIRKGLDLQGLADLLISRHDVFQNWNDENDRKYLKSYASFVDALTPWMVSPPSSGPVSLPLIHQHPTVNCSNPIFKYALSGKELQVPRLIVDFIPFGFDIDKLEIRLHENYYSVDAFVIFESTLTQIGMYTVPHLISSHTNKSFNACQVNLNLYYMIK